jgi:hypothetical protein
MECEGQSTSKWGCRRVAGRPLCCSTSSWEQHVVERQGKLGEVFDDSSTRLGDDGRDTLGVPTVGLPGRDGAGVTGNRSRVGSVREKYTFIPCARMTRR